MGRWEARGRNRFLNNGVRGYVPPGADPAGIDTVEAGFPVVFDGDVSVTNDSHHRTHLSAFGWTNNSSGGGPPVFSPTIGQNVDVYVPKNSNVSVHQAASYLTTDPK